VSAPEPRPIVRHRAPSAVRRYPVAVAGLVTLACAPMVAAVLLGSAAITTSSHPRSPSVADPSQDPVVVPGHGGLEASEITDAPGGTPTCTPTASPSPTAGGPDAAPVDAVTVRGRSAQSDGSLTHSSVTPQRPVPPPPPSNGGTSGGQPAPAPDPLPTALLSPTLPTLPILPTLPLPGLPGLLPGPSAGSPATPGAGTAANPAGVLGGLLATLLGGS
jgi:hypothetical protein